VIISQDLEEEFLVALTATLTQAVALHILNLAAMMEQYNQRLEKNVMATILMAWIA
jgi:hypothetical protein